MKEFLGDVCPLPEPWLNVLLVDWMLKKVYGCKYLTTHHALYVLVLSCMIFANCEKNHFEAARKYESDLQPSTE